jgi:hypothetical protein
MKHTTKYILILIFTICSLASNTIHAQRLSFNSSGFLGLANNVEAGYFYDGGNFELSYQHDLEKGAVQAGINYRWIHWGAQSTISGGYSLPLWQQGPWQAQLGANAELGLALFRPRSLFVWGINAIPSIRWQSKKAFYASFGLGLQFNHAPAYRKYGAINWTLDVPLQLGIGFRLKK